jgi:hypothetical protein
MVVRNQIEWSGDRLGEAWSVGGCKMRNIVKGLICESMMEVDCLVGKTRLEILRLAVFFYAVHS